MLVRQRKTFKSKRPLTFKEAIVIIMSIHLAGIGVIWYLPIAVSKIQLFLSRPSPTIIQPAAPYSDALERAFLTLRDWTKTDKQLVRLPENNLTKKHK